ncbi:hypothetical protein [Mesorhizobium sp. M0228]|uniref:hypothetical protein n=1 Tax=Mesorhizobium sp. M0228 TaxID=2956923 RepID=UPI0033361EA4
MSCYEAGYDGFRLHRFLCERGVDNQVLDAASIPVDRRSRRAKTDRLDAAALLRTLMALDRGEPRVCRVVRVPSLAGERSLSQPETGSARERTRPAFEPHQGALDGPGHPRLQTCQARDWREQLEALSTADGRALPACLKREI